MRARSPTCPSSPTRPPSSQVRCRHPCPSATIPAPGPHARTQLYGLTDTHACTQRASSQARSRHMHARSHVDPMHVLSPTLAHLIPSLQPLSPHTSPTRAPPSAPQVPLPARAPSRTPARKCTPWPPSARRSPGARTALHPPPPRTHACLAHSALFFSGSACPHPLYVLRPKLLNAVLLPWRICAQRCFRSPYYIEYTDLHSITLYIINIVTILSSG